MEGDAILTYSIDPGLTGAELLDLIDGTHAAFCRRLLSVGQATTCGCAACALIPRLDLKLIAHSGHYSRQQIAGQTELVGRDVITSHRLLKNTIGFAGPASGYMLLTDTCVQPLSIDSASRGLNAPTSSGTRTSARSGPG